MCGWECRVCGWECRVCVDAGADPGFQKRGGC